MTKIGSVDKLVPNLGNKSKYVLHYKNLQLYLSLAIKLVSVYRILKFKSSDWLKKLILILIKERMLSIGSEKDFLKLMDNSVYGKALENLRKRVKIGLVNNAKDKKICKQTKFCFTENIFSEILLLFIKLSQF